MDKICQSCGMPLLDEQALGVNMDSSPSDAYCKYCFINGQFAREESMADVVENSIPFALKQGLYPDEQSARMGMMAYFPSLKRWKRQ